MHGDVFSPGNGRNTEARSAAEAVARAKADVARRGLVATIVTNYYTLVAAERKFASAQQALREAQQFLEITRPGERRRGRARRCREGTDSGRSAGARRVGGRARRTENPARAVGAHLPDFRDHFTIVDDLQPCRRCPPLTKSTARDLVSPDSAPQKRRCRQEHFGVALRVAVSAVGVVRLFLRHQRQSICDRRSEGHNLLGSVAQVELNVPIFNWGAAQSKLRQAHLRVGAAKAELTLAQRQLQANVSTFRRKGGGEEEEEGRGTDPDLVALSGR